MDRKKNDNQKSPIFRESKIDIVYQSKNCYLKISVRVKDILTVSVIMLNIILLYVLGISVIF